LDLDAIAEHFGDLESAERLDSNTLRFSLKEQNQGVFTFKGRYACRYLPDGEAAVVWQDLGDGNVKTSGRALVEPGPRPGTARLTYNAQMVVDIDVNPMLVPVLRPIVEASIPHQMKGYVKRMIARF
jgi:hypothetical protein